jgi:selenoprotein W-related protein
VSRDLLVNYQHVIDELRLITGTSGAFEVVFDGKKVFSKIDGGRHAEEGEILGLFADLVGPDVALYGT